MPSASEEDSAKFVDTQNYRSIFLGPKFMSLLDAGSIVAKIENVAKMSP
jgi:hypothetical protein